VTVLVLENAIQTQTIPVFGVKRTFTVVSFGIFEHEVHDISLLTDSASSTAEILNLNFRVLSTRYFIPWIQNKITQFVFVFRYFFQKTAIKFHLLNLVFLLLDILRFLLNL